VFDFEDDNIKKKDEMRWERLQDMISSRCDEATQSKGDCMCASNDEVFVWKRQNGVHSRTIVSYNLEENYWSQVFFPENSPIYIDRMLPYQDIILVFRYSTLYSLKNPRKVKEAKKKRNKRPYCSYL